VLATLCSAVFADGSADGDIKTSERAKFAIVGYMVAEEQIESFLTGLAGAKRAIYPGEISNVQAQIHALPEDAFALERSLAPEAYRRYADVIQRMRNGTRSDPIVNAQWMGFRSGVATVKGQAERDLDMAKESPDAGGIARVLEGARSLLPSEALVTALLRSAQ
jgi:hypothetical protein